MRLKVGQEIHFRDLVDLAKPRNDWAHIGPLVGVAFCLLIYFFTIIFQAVAGFSSTLPLLDFGSLYGSEYAWAHHLNPYLDYPLTYHPRFEIRGLFVHAVNLNPPASLYLFRPIIALGPIVSVQLWTLFSVCLFIISVVLVIRENPNRALRTRILLILGMAGVWYTFQLGQVYMLLLLLTVIAWLAFRRKAFVPAGLSIGILCALKPTFLVWPVLLILARHTKAGISALLLFVAVSILPLVSGNGVELYKLWMTACRNFNGMALPSNSSIVAMMMRLDPYLGTTHDFRNVGYALTLILLLFTAWLVFRRAPDVFRTSEIALVVSLLAGPVSWAGYTVVLIPVLYARQLNSLMRIGWIVLCIPLFAVTLSATSSNLLFTLMGSPYFYGVALIAAPLMFSLCREQAATRPLSQPEMSLPDSAARTRKDALETL